MSVQGGLLYGAADNIKRSSAQPSESCAEKVREVDMFDFKGGNCSAVAE